MAILQKTFGHQDPHHDPWYELLRLGPTIDVCVDLHPAQKQAMHHEGREAGKAVLGTALIDTGASTTIIDQRVFESLRPKVHAYTNFKGFRDEPASSSPVFHIQISFPGFDLPPWEQVAAAAPLATKSHRQVVLLGRDFLRNYRFIYNGIQGGIILESSDS